MKSSLWFLQEGTYRLKFASLNHFRIFKTQELYTSCLALCPGLITAGEWWPKCEGSDWAVNPRLVGLCVKSTLAGELFTSVGID